MVRLIIGCFVLSVVLACGTKTSLSETRVQEDEGTTVIIGEQDLNGVLYTTKGAQYVVSGVILKNSSLKELFGNEYREEMNVYMDKRVKTHGLKTIYYCPPNVQCLEGGKIEFLEDITYIELAQ